MVTLIAEPAPVRASVQDPMIPRLYRVRRTRWDTNDTFSMELIPAEGGEIPAYKAGQFNMLYVYGVGEIPVSISGDPAKRDALIHTTRAVGTVTRAMSELKAGDMLGVRGPFGT